MKKLILVIAMSFCLLGLCPNFATATGSYVDDGDDPCAMTGIDDPAICAQKNKNEEAEMMKKVGDVLNVIFGLIGVIAVIFVIIGGIKLQTSQGDPAKVQQGKSTIMFALIGLVVTLGAFAITAFVLQALGSGGPGTGGGLSSQVVALEITSETTMKEGKTMQLKVKISPDYAEDKTLKFKSSNPSVATISDDGLITAIKAGTTLITATSSNGISAMATITVKEDVKVTGVKIEPETATVKVGGTTTLKATITPTNADAEITWTSSDTSIATVDKDGVVKGVKEGTATITAKAGDIEATSTVTVGEAAAPTTKYSAVWEKRTYSGTGESFDFWINVPEGATSNMPLVLFLHGDGEMGNANAVKNLRWVQYIHESKGFIGLAPIGKNHDWKRTSIQEGLKGLLDKYMNEYKSDQSRIYIWGFSRGAMGLWSFVNRYPTLFAAAVPVSGCAEAITPSNWKTTKVYALAGSQEGMTCMSTTVNQINSAGGSAQFKSVAGQSHTTITKNFPYTEIIDNWMLKQKK